MSLNEEQRSAQIEELQTNDPEQDALRGINEDSPVEPYESGWLVKQIGDSQTFNKDDGTVSYASVLIKSLRWQGAFTVAGVIYIYNLSKANMQTYILDMDLKELHSLYSIHRNLMISMKIPQNRKRNLK